MFDYDDVSRKGRAVKITGVLAAVVLSTAIGACGGGESDMGGEPEAAADAAAASTGTPRVFFVAPMNETDHPTELPLAFTFGIEKFQISPVPEEAASPRATIGHYHLGVNAECLPAGEIIPAADPWIHFGDGSDGMEMTLEDGEYRFSVQIGDDEHRTIEGLCETIVVRMESGI